MEHRGGRHEEPQTPEPNISKDEKKKMKRELEKRRKAVKKQKRDCLKRELESFCGGTQVKRRYYKHCVISIGGDVMLSGFVSQELVDNLSRYYANTKHVMIICRNRFVRTVRITKRLVVKSVKKVRVTFRKTRIVTVATVKKMEIGKKKAKMLKAVEKLEIGKNTAKAIKSVKKIKLPKRKIMTAPTLKERFIHHKKKCFEKIGDLTLHIRTPHERAEA